MTDLIPLHDVVAARIDAGRISTTLDEFLGTIGLQRAVAHLAADTAGRLAPAALQAVVKSRVASYRWELPAASDAYWAQFGDAFAAAFSRYRTSNAWTDRDACDTEEARDEERAVRTVGAGVTLTRNLVAEYSLMLGNRAGWRRFKKFAQAERCGLDAAFDRWYPCSRARFLVEDATGRRVLKLVLDAVEAAPDEGTVYELLAVVERFSAHRAAIFEELARGDAAAPFDAVFAQAAGLAVREGALLRLVAAALSFDAPLAAPRRAAFVRMCRAAGIDNTASGEATS